ncbi:MAG: NRDE family protein [Deltaproteobacteria bacterium]
MCLLLFSYRIHPDYRLIVAANRDEFYARPTAALDYWADHADVLAGRDLKGRGTWLGVTRSGRLAAITNYREPDAHIENAPSRGRLTADFLIGNATPQRYIKAVSKISNAYNGFNLVAGDLAGLYYYSNRASRLRQLQPGLYGISNHLLDTPWPKIKKGKALLQGQLCGREKIDIEKIWKILADRTLPADKDLPDTGVGLEWERILAPLFISSPDYGTRSSSIILMEYSGRTTFLERTFSNAANAAAQGETVTYSFKIRN